MLYKGFYKINYNEVFNLKKSDLFYCYSGKLKRFLLKEKKIQYLHKGFNERTQKYFWVFTRNEELNNALTEWSRNKL